MTRPVTFTTFPGERAEPRAGALESPAAPRPVGVEPWQSAAHRAWTAIQGGQTRTGLQRLLEDLNRLRAAATPAEWSRVVAECLLHPLRGLLHEDPFTRRAFAKPRGYAGDAAVLDYCYDPPEVHLPREVTPTGASVFRFLHASASVRGVRERRRILARAIDDTAERVHRARILSVACGHARELELSSAVRAGVALDFVGLDHDAESLARAATLHGAERVHPVHAPVRDVLNGQLALEGFDLVYSTSLYDYLKDGTAMRLTQLLFRALRPGGRLLVANTLPGTVMRGYMEAFMAWPLEFRTSEQLLAIASAVPDEARALAAISRDAHDAFAYLDLRRR